MGSTVRLRSRATQALGAVMVTVAVAALVLTATEGLEAVLRYAAPLALFALLGWAAFWQPYVEVTDGGVEIANTLRTVEVPWPAVEEVEGRYGLRLRTAYGPVTAWAASAPSGRDRAAGRPGLVAAAVTERLEELRAEGFLDDRRIERPRPRTRWHVAVLAAAGVLLALSVAGLTLT